MIVATFLEQASACKTNEQTAELLAVFAKQFSGLGLQPHSMESSLSDEGGPYMSFLMDICFSDYFCLTIRPSLRAGLLSIRSTVFMSMTPPCNLSKNSNVVGDMDDYHHPHLHVSFADVVQYCKDLSISYHTQLLECAGAPRNQAKEIAAMRWQPL